MSKSKEPVRTKMNSTSILWLKLINMLIYISNDNKIWIISWRL